MGRLLGAGALALLALACGKKEEAPASGALQAPLGADRLLSVEAVVRGARLYQEHCAQCHGPEAQGHPDWENPKVIAAPPLNGTGNEWKRRKADLVAIIRRGAKRGQETTMPGWDGRLTDQEIEDVIAWFQALWPMDVYDRWQKANAVAGATPKG
jgi:mono/diheme cytochrome c family protein